MPFTPKLLVLIVVSLASLAASAQTAVTYSRKGTTFDEVRDNVKLAIENRGLVVDYQAEVGKMLDRTGADVGSTKKIFANAQTLQFCSAKLSRQAMEVSAGNVVFCPYSIAVYATAAKPDEVFVAYRRLEGGSAGPASRQVLRQVDALLDAVAREAVGQTKKK